MNGMAETAQLEAAVQALSDIVKMNTVNRASTGFLLFQRKTKHVRKTVLSPILFAQNVIKSLMKTNRKSQKKI